MNRITKSFTRLKADGKKGFIPFVTAGDPNMETSLAIVLKLAELGADVIELGVPFSDPMADGPTIQLSSQRALESGMNLARVMELIKHVRIKTDVPIVLFSYLNPLLQFGIQKLAEQASSIGIDGILITDVIDEEAIEISNIFRSNNLDLISLIAPTTTDERLSKIAGYSSGFIYAVSRAGTTGARSDTSSQAESLVSRVSKYSDLPVAVGFGISTRSQIEEVWRYADAAVVGSAIVDKVERSERSEDVIENVEKFVKSLLPAFAKSSA